MDDLKDIWQKGKIEIKAPDLPEKWKYNRVDLAHRILKSLKFEYYGSIILTLIYAPSLVYLGYHLLAFASVAAIVPALIYYPSFIKKMEALHYEHDVHAYLKELHELTKNFLKHYVYYTLALLIFIPPLVLLFLWNKGYDIYDLKFIIIMAGLMIGIGVSTYIGFYIKYGRHFKKVKEMVEMLEE